MRNVRFLPHRFAILAIVLVWGSGTFRFEPSSYGKETDSVGSGTATIVINIRWSQISNRTAEIQLEQGVRLLSVFQPMHSTSSLFPEDQFGKSSSKITVRTENPSTELYVELRCSVEARGILKLRVLEGDRDLGEHRFSFSDLLGQRTDIKLVGNSGTVSIRRKSGDELQVRHMHPHLVFSGNELFSAIATFNFGSPPERRSHPSIHWSIQKNGSQQEAARGNFPFQVPRRNNSPILQQGFSLRLPGEDGGYDISVELVNDSGELMGKTVIPIAVHSGGMSSDLAKKHVQSRLFALAVHDPAEILGSCKGQQAESGSSVACSDWSTMFRFADRLSTMVESRGLNGLMLGVHLDGGSLYPTSSVYENLIRYDNGRCDLQRPDPERKDILELLFREFDRRNLILIPELDLSCEDPLLEKSVKKPRGMDIRGSSKVPYDPLSPIVQDRIFRIHQEIIDRYGHHASFGGIALSIHDESWASLGRVDPGEIRTISIEKSGVNANTRHQEGSAELKSTRSEPVQPIPEADVVAERCRKLADVYERISDSLVRRRSDLKYFLTVHRLVSGENFHREVLNQLHSGGVPDFPLSVRGFDPRLYRQQAGIVLLFPYCTGALTTLGTGVFSGVLDLNDVALIKHSASPLSGAMNVPLSTTGQMSDQDLNSGLAGYLTHILTASVPGPVFIDHDTISRNGKPIEAIETINRLPETIFATVPNAGQPVVVKQARIGDKAWLYAVNETSIPATVKISCHTDGRCEIVPLTPSSSIETSESDPIRSWIWKLEPQSVKSCVANSPQFEVSSLSVAVDQESFRTLQGRVEKLETSKVRRAFHSEPVSVLLPNAGFESKPADGGIPPGWNYLYNPELPPRLDETIVHSGSASLLLERYLTSHETGITSFPLQISGITDLTTSFWTRSSATDLSLTVRLSGKVEGEKWIREATVHPNLSWQQVVFRVPELPRKIADVELSVLINEPGQVWFDDFEMFPYSLTPEDERRLMRAVASIRLAWEERRYADCSRLLDGYWGRFLTSPPALTVNGERSPTQLGVRYRDLILR